MDEWLEDLDKCKDMGWYFEIESEESGRLANDIRKVLARIEQLEAALRRLDIAAARRDNSLGDPIRVLEAKAELLDAAKYARTVLAKGVSNGSV